MRLICVRRQRQIHQFLSGQEKFIYQKTTLGGGGGGGIKIVRYPNGFLLLPQSNPKWPCSKLLPPSWGVYNTSTKTLILPDNPLHGSLLHGQPFKHGQEIILNFRL